MDRTGARVSASNPVKLRLFVAVVAGIVILDLITKLAIENSFRPFEQMDLIGSYVRLTYIHNPGAAFGIHLGPYSRVVFLALSLVAIAVLAALYWHTPAADRVRLLAIALVSAGAAGNLIDRLRSPRGVVDFVDVGVGDLRWPVFNVADMAVTTGAVILALSLWREDKRIEAGG
jgi:signal peptidase II